tara:strand:+ start:993 stop:2075 length:1083 start_codon:yes stop_codon:yes gene_type:complete
MKIELKEITLKKLSEDYIDNQEEGVLGYSGKLDIRPPYQREFIYDDKQRDLVINTVFKNFPLNVFYWAVKKDKNYEVIDGQQRTISICQYINGDFAFEGRYFYNLQEDEVENILNYKIMVYFCSGTDSEKLDWFKTINIAGEQLTQQELRNAVYSGSWVSDAKRYFSKSGCAAYGISSDYIMGSPIRQDYLETAINWISNNDIEEYMGKHQDDPTAIELWNYFQSVISWVEASFINKRKFMKGVPWGFLYNQYKGSAIDPSKIEDEISQLILDDDVTNKKGIYSYVLTRDEKHLSIRAFTDAMKQKVFELQKGVCIVCKELFSINEMEADHITPWHAGGKTLEENCQMLCKDCNRKKSGK